MKNDQKICYDQKNTERIFVRLGSYDKDIQAIILINILQVTYVYELVTIPKPRDSEKEKWDMNWRKGHLIINNCMSFSLYQYRFKSIHSRLVISITAFIDIFRNSWKQLREITLFPQNVIKLALVEYDKIQFTMVKHLYCKYFAPDNAKTFI